MITATS